MLVNATDFKNMLEEFLDMTNDEPVFVHKTGRPIAVVLGVMEYERLQMLDEL